jgi:hypothetical protein
MLRYVVQIPIDQKNAKRRGLDPTLSELLIHSMVVKQINDSAFYDILSKFSELIWAFCGSATCYSQPIYSFKRLKKYAEELENSHIKYWFDYKSTDKPRGEPLLLTAQCESINNIFHLMQMFKAEAIVFFSSTDSSIVNQDIRRRLLRAPKYGRQYEQPYLQEIATYGFFIFYASSHLSLEILSCRENILKFFSQCFQIAQ